MSPKSPKLKIRIPFYCAVTSPFGFLMKAFSVQSNPKQVQIQTDFTELLIPDVIVSINGEEQPLDKRLLVEELKGESGRLVRITLGYLEDFAKTSLPEMINAKIREIINGPVRQVNLMDPPGVAKPQPGDKYFWGLELRNLSSTKDHLILDLSGYVEDLLEKLPPLAPEFVAKSPARVDALSPADYDLALTINQGFFNRVLDLNKKKGYFENVPLSVDAPITGENPNTDYIRLTATPVLDLVDLPLLPGSGGGQAFPRMRVKVRGEMKVRGIKRWVVKNKNWARFSLDIYIRFKVNANGLLAVALDSIDVESIQVDKKTIVPGFLKLARKAAQDEARKKNEEWKIREAILIPELPLPPRLLDIPFKIRHVTHDSKGQVVLFLDYGDGP